MNEVASLRSPGGKVRRGDRWFRTATICAAVGVLAVIIAIAVFLVYRAIPSLQRNSGDFWTTSAWHANTAPYEFGIAALAVGTLISSALALVIATPVAVGVAIALTEYVPRRPASWLGHAVDMLAAIPSVVYGLWGLYVLVPWLHPVQDALARFSGWFPLFSVPVGASAATGTLFTASVVLAVMVLPIVTAIAREVMRTVPREQREASLALGATRWEMIRTSVLPPSRGGLTAAVMLGMGRALGETIAVALVLGTSYEINWHVLQPGGNTIAANIALQFGESTHIGLSALIASGLVLFGITLVVNIAARGVIVCSARKVRPR